MGRGNETLMSKQNLIRRKPCLICCEKSLINYKNTELLKFFVTDGGKIVPRRISGVCAKHQRELTQAVKRARNIGLLSFTKGYVHQDAGSSS